MASCQWILILLSMFKANLAVRYDGGDRVIPGWRWEDHHDVTQRSFVLPSRERERERERERTNRDWLAVMHLKSFVCPATSARLPSKSIWDCIFLSQPPPRERLEFFCFSVWPCHVNTSEWSVVRLVCINTDPDRVTLLICRTGICVFLQFDINYKNRQTLKSETSSCW